eukprot:TRINITY_DN6558_c0_g1_i2.p1 TRINITY_DN6558_c0_g1~~TRINITY_DN6558_c0_g1_i2.p1  ORF type:complete len:155 (-),score=13.22 TRINITY_DN6558_c0_g1_i2:328-735(-)
MNVDYDHVWRWFLANQVLEAEPNAYGRRMIHSHYFQHIISRNIITFLFFIITFVYLSVKLGPFQGTLLSLLTYYALSAFYLYFICAYTPVNLKLAAIFPIYFCVAHMQLVGWSFQDSEAREEQLRYVLHSFKPVA